MKPYIKKPDIEIVIDNLDWHQIYLYLRGYSFNNEPFFTVFSITKGKTETATLKKLRAFIMLKKALLFRTAEIYSNPVLYIKFNNSWNTKHLQGSVLEAIKKAFTI